MEDWVKRAMQRWPNVPLLFGWLGLDRRGRWLIKGEIITRPQIIDTIARNYAADDHGRWYFQNGPQRGYVELEHAPLVLQARAADEEHLETHTGLPVQAPSQAYMDEEGALLLATEHGIGAIADQELDWALQRLADAQGQPIDEDALASVLALPSGQATALSLRYGDTRLPVRRLDREAAPAALGFVRQPQPRDGERVSGGAEP